MITHAIPRDRETPVTCLEAGGFRLRYAYARAAETRQAGEAGQDYLTFGGGDGFMTFALCDGISQSFYGDLAAVFLGDALRDWLYRGLPRAPLSGHLLEGALHAFLVRLTEPATTLVRAHPVAPGGSPMFRSVLEEKRQQGSEACFVAGRIDLPGPAHPGGRLLLAWMGDCRCRLWGDGRECTSLLAAEPADKRCWSSRTGPVGGGPGFWLSSLADLGENFVLTAYSDGLSQLDASSAPPSDDGLQVALRNVDLAAQSDDAAFVEIQGKSRIW